MKKQYGGLPDQKSRKGGANELPQKSGPTPGGSVDSGGMGTSGAYTWGASPQTEGSRSRGAEGRRSERDAELEGLEARSLVGFDALAVSSPLPQTGTGATSVGRGAGCTIADGSKPFCEPAGEKSDPAKI